MTKVISDISMSLDGFIAGPDDGPGNGLGDGGEPLHTWINEQDPFHMEKLTGGLGSLGSMICGRLSYDIAHKPWNERQMFPEANIIVLTHRPEADYTAGSLSYFFADSFERGLEIAKEKAGPDRAVALHGATPVQQALQHGELDEIVIRLVPYLLGGGKPLFGETGIDPTWLESLEGHMTPTATYLRYRVKK